MDLRLLRTLVLLVATTPFALVASAHADDETDLKIELTGKPSGNNKRQLTFSVTNVSPMWANDTTVHIETVSPGPANGTNPDPVVRELDPGQTRTVTYTLGADCNGHVVKAVLKPAVNFADVPEVQLGNNTFQGPACEAAPGPGGPATGFDPNTAGVIQRPGDEFSVVMPERIRPGLHADGGALPAVTLEPSLMRGNHLEKIDTGPLGNVTCPIVGRASGDDPFVGFAFFDNAGCNDNFASQFVVSFDLDWLREQRNNVTRADLFFNENITISTDDNNKPITQVTCIGKLGIAPANFADVIAQKQFITSEPVQGDRLFSGAASQWDVTRDIRWVSTGTNERLTGIVFHGADEELDVETERRCGADLINIRLKVQYEVFR